MKLSPAWLHTLKQRHRAQALNASRIASGNTITGAPLLSGSLTDM